MCPHEALLWFEQRVNSHYKKIVAFYMPATLMQQHGHVGMAADRRKHDARFCHCCRRDRRDH